MADFVTPKALDAKNDRDPYHPDNAGMGLRGFSDAYGSSLPSSQSQDEALAIKLKGDFSATQSAFEKDVAKQGFIGEAFDWMKGHAGASGASDSPIARGWSNILNYDDSSVAIRKNLTVTQEKLNQFAEAPSAASFARSIQSETNVQADGSITLKTDTAATRYDRSQASGVNGIADAAVLAYSLAERRGAKTLLRSAFAGAGVKSVLKALDGTYSTPLDDILSGGLIGTSVSAARAGREASESIVKRLHDDGLVSEVDKFAVLKVHPRVISSFKSGMEFAPVGALGAVSSTYMASRFDGASRVSAAGDGIANAPNGAAQGFLAGALFGLLPFKTPEVPGSSVPPPEPPLPPLNNGGLGRQAEASSAASRTAAAPDTPPAGDGGRQMMARQAQGDASKNGKLPVEPKPDVPPPPGPGKTAATDKAAAATPPRKMHLLHEAPPAPPTPTEPSDTPRIFVNKEVPKPGSFYRPVSELSESEQIANAKARSSSPERLDDLSRVDVPEVQIAVAENLRTSGMTLERLANSPNTLVKAAVARSPIAFGRTLETLSHDHNSLVRMMVAKNTNSSMATLTGLLEDPSAQVRSSAAKILIERGDL